ncbi:MAG: hypothetical protein HY401_10450 [Elusimicrobia bacterium]|nr:hypothetical protein [Elusimicrobiota bacterium]
MRKRGVLICIFYIAGALGFSGSGYSQEPVEFQGLNGAQESSDICSFDAIQRDARGFGFTGLQGTQRTRFDFGVLFPWDEVLGLGSRTFWVRFLGEGELVNKGVFGGMSGSPLYLYKNGSDEKDGSCLAGAVSFGFLGVKEPIAGATYFGDMYERGKGGGQAPRSVASARHDAWSAVVEAYTKNNYDSLAAAFNETQINVRNMGLDPDHLTLKPQKIEHNGNVYDLLMSFGSIDAANYFENQAVSGAGSAALTGPSELPLPGSPIAVPLVVGHGIAITAFGTLTTIKDGRIYAFGHPFLNLGPTSLPVFTSQTGHVASNIMRPSVIPEKVVSPLGVIDYDDSSGISGKPGPLPALSPFVVRLKREGVVEREISFSVIQHPFLLPYHAAMLIKRDATTGGSYGGFSTNIHASAKLEWKTDSGESHLVNVNNVFVGPAGSWLLAYWLYSNLFMMSNNPFEQVTLAKAEIDLNAYPHSLQAIPTELKIQGAQENKKDGRYSVIKIAKTDSKDLTKIVVKLKPIQEEQRSRQAAAVGLAPEYELNIPKKNPKNDVGLLQELKKGYYRLVVGSFQEVVCNTSLGRLAAEFAYECGNFQGSPLIISSAGDVAKLLNNKASPHGRLWSKLEYFTFQDSKINQDGKLPPCLERILKGEKEKKNKDEGKKKKKEEVAEWDSVREHLGFSRNRADELCWAGLGAQPAWIGFFDLGASVPPFEVVGGKILPVWLEN